MKFMLLAMLLGPLTLFQESHHIDETAACKLERSVNKHREHFLVIDHQLLRFDDEVSPVPVSRAWLSAVGLQRSDWFLKASA